MDLENHKKIKRCIKINYIVLADTRQQKDTYITNYFDKHEIMWIRTKLPSADYMIVRCGYKEVERDYSTLIDTKKDVEEIAGNLCNNLEHKRILREFEVAKEKGCKEFIFLICDSKIKSVDDLKKWSSKKTKVKGETLFKIMSTMHKKYGMRFIFTDKKNAGKYVVRLLTKNLEN